MEVYGVVTRESKLGTKCIALLLLFGAIPLLACYFAAGAQELGISVRADKETYYNGDRAVVTLEGLTSCAGQMVELGFLQSASPGGGPEPVGDASPLVTVNTVGSASVTVVMTSQLIPFHTAPFVRGNCVPAGEIIGEPKAITILLATNPNPAPPAVGTAAERTSTEHEPWSQQG
jgi:hypothetical protein